MQAAVNIPVTVKCRIGIDDRDDWEFLREFVAAVSEAGCRTVIVHARKAILKGLTPKENREVPPLDYARAWRVKQEFPTLTIVANGGLRTVPQVTEQLAHVDGVMLGREAYHNPYLLPALHRAVHDDGFETPPVEHVVLRMRALRRTPGRRGDAVAFDDTSHARAVQWPRGSARVAARAVGRREPEQPVACAHRRRASRSPLRT